MLKKNGLSVKAKRSHCQKWCGISGMGGVIVIGENSASSYACKLSIIGLLQNRARRPRSQTFLAPPVVPVGARLFSILNSQFSVLSSQLSALIASLKKSAFCFCE